MHCAECHGEMAEGGRKAPSLLAEQVPQATPDTLFWILTNGVVRHGMPVWSKLRIDPIIGVLSLHGPGAHPLT